MGVNILIIEADALFRQSLTKRLAGKEKRILQVDRLSEAKKMVKRNNIDVALLGLASLKREALATLKMIKKVRPLTEVITINASGQVALSIEAMKLGAFDDLMGPFTIESLDTRIQEAWLRKQQRAKERKPLLRRYMDLMAAGAFAEAGEHEMALAYLENKKSPASTPKKKEPDMEQIKILFVDDEEEFVKALAERIKMRDLESDVALNGEEALQIVKDQVPDVMVLDLKMPGIDGMEVLRRVKKAYPEVQVIILTGHGSEKDEKNARRLGAFDYLRKPVDIEELVQNIKRAYKSKIENTMTAAAFAEAGDFDTAKEIMDREKNKS